MTKTLSLLALALSLPFSACATEPDTIETNDTTIEAPDMTTDMDNTMADDTMDDGAMTDGTMGASTVTAQGTVDAVTGAGGLTSLAPSAAVQNIDGWIAQLRGNPDFAPVVTDLETLKTQLMASPIDGAAVGATLKKLGSATTGAAGGDTALETLGSTLSAAGDQLAGGAM